jgi:hypothetical protein
VRPLNFGLSFIADVVRALGKALSNGHILFFGARQGGKSTAQKFLYLDSSDFREPERTGKAGPIETYKIDYLGDEHDSFKVKIQDVAGDRIHWGDTVRRIVNAKPSVIIFMLRAFELRPDGQDVKKSEHLKRVPGLMDSFRIMKLDDMKGNKKDSWYCGEDMEAFEFLITLLFDHHALYAKYPDVMSQCSDIHQKLYKKRGKLAPKLLYVAVNFVDTLPDDEVTSRVNSILKPYESLLIRWTDNKVKVRRMGISARYGHNIEEMLKDIGRERKWT